MYCRVDSALVKHLLATYINHHSRLIRNNLSNLLIVHKHLCLLLESKVIFCCHGPLNTLKWFKFGGPLVQSTIKNSHVLDAKRSENKRGSAREEAFSTVIYNYGVSTAHIQCLHKSSEHR